jgi:hypothetical protein
VAIPTPGGRIVRSLARSQAELVDDIVGCCEKIGRFRRFEYLVDLGSGTAIQA